MASRSGERRPNMTRTARTARSDLVSDALRQLWATAETDPVPDEFLALLDRLDAARAMPGRPGDADGLPNIQDLHTDDGEAPAA